MNEVAASVRLSPPQAAVVAALERLLAAVQLEANQLGGLWGQPEAADSLGAVAQVLLKQRDDFLTQKTSRLLVASALPQPTR